MAEGFKAGSSMIAAHATEAYTSKAHIAGGKMKNGIIDAAASKGKGAKCPGFHPLVLGK